MKINEYLTDNNLEAIPEQNEEYINIRLNNKPKANRITSLREDFNLHSF